MRTRSRLHAGLIVAALAVLAVAPSAFAAVEQSSTGIIGTYKVKDSAILPGVDCVTLGGEAWIYANSPKVYAADVTPFTDYQQVGWQIVLQRRNVRGQYQTVDHSPVFTARASDTKAAPFDHTQMLMENTQLHGRFRVLLVLYWFGPRGEMVRGTVTSRIQWYGQPQKDGSPTVYGSCVD